MSMMIKDLITKKDYDYIEWRTPLPENLGGGDLFVGISKSQNGELISLDGDSYSENTPILSYEEWSDSKANITSGLTVVYESKWEDNK